MSGRGRLRRGVSLEVIVEEDDGNGPVSSSLSNDFTDRDIATSGIV